jgi:RNase P subunit RPR2
MNGQIEYPICDKCHVLMARNGTFKTQKGAVTRFRCRVCGASKHALIEA